jgi:hypothetical protein
MLESTLVITTNVSVNSVKASIASLIHRIFEKSFHGIQKCILLSSIKSTNGLKIKENTVKCSKLMNIFCFNYV